MDISLRIKSIVNEIQQKTLADIGTDHGYIPIYAYKTLKVHRAIACDINKDPLLNAKSNIIKYGLSNHIETRLGSGITPINKNEVKTITIAGMGGDLIIKILNEKKEVAQSAQQIILQPQSKLESVRKYIHSIGFKIVNETFIKEDEKYYTIINCLKGKEEQYTFTQYFIGKILIEKKDTLFINYIEKEKRKLELILSNIKVDTGTEQRVSQLKRYIEAYKEVL